MTHIPIEIASSRHYSVEVDSDHFGELFSKMASDDQVAVLRAMVDHMTPHELQWDYINIELNMTENNDLRIKLRDIFGNGATE